MYEVEQGKRICFRIYVVCASFFSCSKYNLIPLADSEEKLQPNHRKIDVLDRVYLYTDIAVATSSILM